MGKTSKQFDRIVQNKNEHGEREGSTDKFDSLPSHKPPIFQLAADPNPPSGDSEKEENKDEENGSDHEKLGSDSPQGNPSEGIEAPDDPNKPEEVKPNGESRKAVNKQVKKAVSGLYKQAGIRAVQMKRDPGRPILPSFSEKPVQMKAHKPAFSTSGKAQTGDVMGKMGAAMKTDFSNVNIHKNSPKAKEMGALAYTQGNDVHFAPGKYKPETKSGQELIGHELAHVKQQREGRVKPTTSKKGKPVNDDSKLEFEADQMGKKAAAFTPSAPVRKPSHAPAPITPKSPIQRKEAVANEEENATQDAKEAENNSPQPDSPVEAGQNENSPEEGKGSGNEANLEEESTGTAPTEERGNSEPDEGAIQEEGPAGKSGNETKKETEELAVPDESGEAEPGQAEERAPGISGGVQHAKANPVGNQIVSKAKELAQQPLTFAMAEVNGKGEDAKLDSPNANKNIDEELELTSQAVVDLNSTLTSNIADNVSQLVEVTPEIAASIEGAIERGTGAIRGAVSGQSVVIDTNFNTLKAEVKAEAERVRASIQNEAGLKLNGLSAEFAVKKVEIESAAIIAKGEVDARLITHKEDIWKKYQGFRDKYRKAGVNAGQSAYDHGNNQAIEWEGKKTGEMGRLIDWYLEDRRWQAKADAAREVGKAFQEALVEEGEKQAQEAMKGIVKDQQAAAEVAAMHKEAIDEAKTILVEVLKAQYESAKQGIESERLSSIVSLSQEEATTLALLKQDRDERISLLDEFGESRIEGLKGIGEAAAQNLGLTLEEAGSALVDSLAEMGTFFESTELPDPEPYQELIDGINEKIASSTTEIIDAVRSGLMTISESIDEAAMNTQVMMAQAVIEGNQGATEIKNSFLSQAEVIEQGALANIGQFYTDFVSHAQEIKASANEAFVGINQALDTQFQQDLAKLDTVLTEAVVSLETGLIEAFKGDIDAKISEEAQKAYEKVQPKWKGILKILLIIAVILVFALVLGPLVLAAAGGLGTTIFGSGVAATVFGGALGGAILGASSAAIMKLGNNAIDGNLGMHGGKGGLFQGVGESALKGGITGMLTGGLGARYPNVGGKLNSQLGRLAASRGFDAAMDLTVDLSYSIAKDLLTGKPFGTSIPSWKEIVVNTVFSMGMKEVVKFGINNSSMAQNIMRSSYEMGAGMIPGGGASVTPGVDVMGDDVYGPASKEGTDVPRDLTRTEAEWKRLNEMSGADQASHLGITEPPPPGHSWVQGKKGMPHLRNNGGDTKYYYDFNNNTYSTSGPGTFTPTKSMSIAVPGGDAYNALTNPTMLGPEGVGGDPRGDYSPATYPDNPQAEDYKPNAADHLPENWSWEEEKENN